jgi:hypothetical protein
MITILTHDIAFQGHSTAILWSAVRCCKHFDFARGVILFSDEGCGANECTELGQHHEYRVNRHESRFKCVKLMFDRAQEIPRHRAKHVPDFGEYFVFSKELYDGVSPILRPVRTRLGISSEALRRSRHENSTGVGPLR